MAALSELHGGQTPEERRFADIKRKEFVSALGTFFVYCFCWRFARCVTWFRKFVSYLIACAFEQTSKFERNKHDASANDKYKKRENAAKNKKCTLCNRNK